MGKYVSWSPGIAEICWCIARKRANKGVFITTSTFAKSAHEYIGKIGSKVVLIDGEKLAELMIEYNIGVSPIALYEVKRIDTDYFNEA